ncbi:hypothetical protein J4573_31650 [Actinomadura barringtoniae]|uniref:Acid phosphatase n=1 Tax=Actinomadura barringtoniae TaxID=1427535 RepID=A0A939PKC8_9ACTN|nr:alkaline phosphatase family protein [Actinomadura barringtoniae]MBO2451683.1 hypothetical protein [Actinomadura barringtoniae]
MPKPSALRRPPGIALLCAAVLAAALALVAMRSGSAHPMAARDTAAQSRLAAPPAFDHVVIVMEENRDDGEITAAAAPYIDQIRKGGASLTEMYGIVHPSQGNYFAQFHGKVEGQLDQCPVPGAPFDRPNLASKLIGAGKTFGAYMQGYPGSPSTCSSGDYVQRHAPWLNFTNVPASTFHTDAEFPADFARLPTVSYVIPDNKHNMHSASVTDGDTYLKNRLGAYAEWAKTHNSLLIVTWDESQVFNSVNDIETVFYGANVKPGEYGPSNPAVGKDNHYNVLRTLEDMYGLGHNEGSVDATPITAPFGTGGGGDPDPGGSCKVANPGDQTVKVGGKVNIKFTSTGCSGTVAYTVSGKLPYVLLASGDTLSGTVYQPGTYPVTVTVKDGAGATGKADFKIVVNWF